VPELFSQVSRWPVRCARSPRARSSTEAAPCASESRPVTYFSSPAMTSACQQWPSRPPAAKVSNKNRTYPIVPYLVVIPQGRARCDTLAQVFRTRIGMVTRLQRKSIIVFGTKKCKTGSKGRSTSGRGKLPVQELALRFSTRPLVPRERCDSISCGKSSCPIATETRLCSHHPFR